MPTPATRWKIQREAPVYEYDRKNGTCRAVESIAQFSVVSVDETRAAIRRERADSPYDSLNEYSQVGLAE